jgi:hypothetical protein
MDSLVFIDLPLKQLDCMEFPFLERQSRLPAIGFAFRRGGRALYKIVKRFYNVI